MSTPKFLVRTAQLCAFAGLLIGGIYGAYDVLTAKYVREFQAGAASPILERLIVIAERSAIEGVGFGFLGLVFGVVAAAVGGACHRFTSAGDTTRAQHASAAFVLACAAFFGWITVGTWLGNEMVPYLSPLESLGLSVAGFFTVFVGILVAHAIVNRLPWTCKREPAAAAVASALIFSISVAISMKLIFGASGGWRVPWRAGGAVASMIVSFPAASFAGRFLETIIHGLGERIGSGRLIPKPVGIALGIVLFACAGVAAYQFDFSTATANIVYPTLPANGKPAGPNVILITIDTLRADHLGCYGYKRLTSPFLDSLAADGTRFADASAAAAWTKPATATILTGLYPSRHGALYHGSELNTPDGGHTLAEVAREKGYVTAGFVSNPNIKKLFKFDRGFDEFFDSPVEDTVTLASFRNALFGKVVTELTRYQFNWKYENDVVEVNRHVFSWLDKNHSEKFFLYLHYIDPHEPYSPPKSYEKQFAQDRGFLIHNKRKQLMGIDLYDGEVRYTDDNLKVLADKLKSYNLWDNTIVIVTADHGEEFFEHGTIGHGFSLYQEVIHVPLIARGPGIDKGKVVNKPVGIVDLAPTVLDLAETGVKELGDGKSFAALFHNNSFKAREHLFLENEFGENENDIRSFVLSGLRSGPWKLVLNERNAYRPPEDSRYGREELYNLETDAGETHNLFKDIKNKDLIAQALEGIRIHAQFLVDKGLRTIKPPALSPEIEAGLRALGYLK